MPGMGWAQVEISQKILTNDGGAPQQLTARHLLKQPAGVGAGGLVLLNDKVHARGMAGHQEQFHALGG